MNNILAVTQLLKSCLRFNAEVSFEEAHEALKAYSATGEFPYNAMPDNMTNIIGEIKNAVGVCVYPGNNPNNGSTCHAQLMIGNENSFVIYVRIIHTYKLDRTIEQIFKGLQWVKLKFKADEFSRTDGVGSTTFRLWWD